LDGEGALLVTYYGHAGINRWANEGLWTTSHIPSLANGSRLPVILSMTCLDGYWIGPVGGSAPQGPGLIEEMLRSPGKGAVAAFSPGGLGVGTGHDVMAAGFFTALFENDEHRLGDAALAAKLALYNSGADQDLIFTFTILGDPALEIARAFPVFIPGLWK
jgi:hypothetical protein